MSRCTGLCTLHFCIDKRTMFQHNYVGKCQTSSDLGTYWRLQLQSDSGFPSTMDPAVNAMDPSVKSMAQIGIVINPCLKLVDPPYRACGARVQPNRPASEAGDPNSLFIKVSECQIKQRIGGGELGCLWTQSCTVSIHGGDIQLCFCYLKVHTFTRRKISVGFGRIVIFVLLGGV